MMLFVAGSMTGAPWVRQVVALLEFVLKQRSALELMVCFMTEPSSRLTKRIVSCGAAGERVVDTFWSSSGLGDDVAPFVLQAPRVTAKASIDGTDRCFITRSVVSSDPERLRACPLLLAGLYTLFARLQPD